MKFRLDDPFLELFPETSIGLLVASNIDNAEIRTRQTAPVLESASEKAAASFRDREIASHPAVSTWREVYRRFGAKPSKRRSSIESLIRSSLYHRVRSINPLVDLYNAVSLEYLLPCGGADLEALHDDIRLTLARGGEHFEPLGSSMVDSPGPGEVIYADEAGVVCRAWNWREAERTKFTNSTTDALLMIETATSTEKESCQAACRRLANLLVEKLEGNIQVAEILDISRPEVDLGL